jgi:translation initiation factor 1 (eIF-1/SUI1)
MNEQAKGRIRIFVVLLLCVVAVHLIILRLIVPEKKTEEKKAKTPAKEVVPPPPPPKTPQQLKQEKMNKADLELLKAFGGDELAVGSVDNNGAPAPRKGRVTFNIQRKGKGGKTVTKVFGLQDLELPEQMELCSAVKNGLGCGARFVEGVLEIQGDQRTRAMAWFADNGYKC